MTADFKGNLSLFPVKEKRSDKSPDMSGTIELTLDQAMAMAEWITAQPGEEGYGGTTVVKLRIAGWEKTSRNGKNYISGLVSAPQPATQNNTADDPVF